MKQLTNSGGEIHLKSDEVTSKACTTWNYGVGKHQISLA